MAVEQQQPETKLGPRGRVIQLGSSAGSTLRDTSNASPEQVRDAQRTAAQQSGRQQDSSGSQSGSTNSNG